MPPFAGPLPPSLTGGPPMPGGAVAPHGNPGQTSGGLSMVRLALEQLQKALPDIPMGTELHDAVLKAVTQISKTVGEAQDSPQMKMQALLGMIQKMKQAQPAAGLAGLASPGAGGQPPAPPIMAPPPPAPPGMAGEA